MKDWTGNSKSIYVTLGASNHTESERADLDYYATEPKAVEMLLQQEDFSQFIWEPACGEGHISEVLLQNGFDVLSTDIVNRGYKGQRIEIDFLKANLFSDLSGNCMDIITNPPYSQAKEFIQKALDISTPGTKIAMFLKLTFLEGQARRKLFEENPPKIVYVFSKRVKCAKNGNFENISSSAVAYAWFIWVKGFRGEPVIRWI